MSRPDRLRQLIVVGVLVILALAALRDLSRLGAGLPWRTMYDFPDFYCAGWAIDHRQSPYTYEPLHACEHHVNSGSAFRSQFFRVNPNLAIPAPLPAYDFLPYMALARLPAEKAALIDAIAIGAAVALCAVALADLGLPLGLVAAALLLSTAFMELNTGQIVPFALLALALCGLALARGQDSLAGIFAVFTAIEPSVGLPVVLAALFFVPRARSAVAITAAVFAILALRVVGVAALVQYASSVLPAQAASEVHFPYQYSLTYLLAFFGVSPDVARLAGAASYFVLLAIGLALGAAVSRRLAKRELIVFVPALCTTIAGAYLHPEELCFALPALLVLTHAARGSARTTLALALCVLAVPWILVWGSKQLFLASLFVCAVILLRLRIDRRVALGFLCVVAAVIYAFELHPPHLPTPVATSHAYSPNELVQNEWHEYAEARTKHDPLWFAIKLPTWFALLAVLSIAARWSLRSRGGAIPKAPTSPQTSDTNIGGNGSYSVSTGLFEGACRSKYSFEYSAGIGVNARAGRLKSKKSLTKSGELWSVVPSRGSPQLSSMNLTMLPNS